MGGQDEQARSEQEGGADMSIVVAPSHYLDPLPRIMTGVSESELDTIRSLMDVWSQKYHRNVLRSTYFDGKAKPEMAGIIPEEAFYRLRAVLGWPAKAVTDLAERSVFEGFTSEDGSRDPFDLRAILDDNRFDLELPQAITSAYKHSCSFITTALGDTRAGDPEVVIMARSAEWSSGLWDRRRRAVKAALTIVDTDDEGRPSVMDAWFPEAVLTCRRRPSGSWVAERRQNPLGEVLVEPISYDPQLDRPFGRSRISRPVMDITDRALRTIMRAEVAAEFYAAPRMYALGVSKDAFSKGKWQAAIDRWFAIGKDQDGDLPEVGQFAQMTMQPLSDQYRWYASQFSGETGVPLSSLGIVTDNPSSAEAMWADDRRLLMTANRQNRIMGHSLVRIARRAIMLRDDLTEVTDEMRQLDASWARVDATSPVTATTGVAQLTQAVPSFGESEVALEMAGLSRPDINRVMADRRRSASRLALAALAGAQPEPEQPSPEVE